MIKDDLVRRTAIELHRQVLFFEIEKIVVCIEHELIFEYRSRMDFVTIAIFDLLHHNEVVLVDVSDESGLMQVGNVEQQMHFAVQMHYSLSHSVTSHLHY